MAQLLVPDLDASERWVAEHLGDLALEGAAGIRRSSRFVGGQTAADAALAGFAVRGYASRRNQVLPVGARGASGLSPYIRHGLLSLPRVWQHAESGPARDRAKFHDELLWQEYARHLYARVGRAIRFPLRREPATGAGWPGDPWPGEMACMAEVNRGLAEDGWLVNQSRMWAASQWTVRAGADWRDGERRMYRDLLDGSAAANGLGWQWTIGAATGKPYGFSRWQVEKRAPELCARCALRERCPVQRWPDAAAGERTDPPDRLRHDADPKATAGPLEPAVTGGPELVWLTAESLGDADPALVAYPDRPAVFVFDEPLLRRLRLSSKRLVFLAECLADLARRRPVEVYRGDPVEVLAGRPLATTYAPVPGFGVRAARLEVVALHPWPWLRRPSGGSVASFTSWVRSHKRENSMTTSAGTESGPELITVQPTTTAVVRGTVSAEEITDFFDRSFSVLGEAIAAQGVLPSGPAFGLYRGIPDETMDLEVGYPTDRAIEPDGSVEAGELPGGRVARTVHAGSFDGLGEAWQRLGGWIADQGLTPAEAYWEVYVTEPSPDMNPDDLRTELNWPVT